jgi:hypothetical protein
MEEPVAEPLNLTNSQLSDSKARTEPRSYFILTVLGFSFWFFMAVPFASHRETYSWLAAALTENATHQLSFGVTSTYRPLAQIVTWALFGALDPHVFPTSVLRQTILQGFVYGTFVLAWWLIYRGAPQRRLFSLIAFIAGGVLFSGYVQLFHIYGVFYVPVVLSLGVVLRLYASGALQKVEAWLAGIAIVLAFWHPFATAVFVGFYFGFYLDTLQQRSRAQHIQAIAILLGGLMAIVTVVFVFPRDQMPLDTRLLGWLVSYQTNEVNGVASIVVFVLCQAVILSMDLAPSKKLLGGLCVCVGGIVSLMNHVPLLLLWICVVLVKLIHVRVWSLFFLALTAALFPFGGAIGSPIHALFAIMVAVYVTSLGWFEAERRLSWLKPRYLAAATLALAIVLVMVRVGIELPIVTRVASPLLAERERTYQLETVLAWLHESPYCGAEIAFVEQAGSPIDSVESAITRRNRPPAALEDVRRFWDSVLRCQDRRLQNGDNVTAIITFGGPTLPDSRVVFEVSGRYAGDATVWIRDSHKLAVAWADSAQVRIGNLPARYYLALGSLTSSTLLSLFL